MRFAGRNTWYKCKLLLLLILLLHLVQLAWFYLAKDTHSVTDQNRKELSNKPADIYLNDLGKSDDFDEDTNKNDKKYVHKLLFPKIPKAKNEYCKHVIDFKAKHPNTISTFDIPDIANYTLDKKGRYYLPEKKKIPPHAPEVEKTVHVTLIPFSHADPGYGMTMEGYYQSLTHSVLDLMVDKLTKYRNMTFQWAETVFLERWFQDIKPEKKQQVKELLKRGQFEVVLGGWVMPDEAVTRYDVVIDQLIEGHQWVTENLGIKPENAWINDPFGYSSTMPYLWKASGMKNMVILRIHQAVKSYLMSKHSLEFMWRPYWEESDRSDILCNLMPYEGYWTSNVCGPEESVCKLFNFLHLGSFGSSAKAVDEMNKPTLSNTLYGQYRFTASLYKYNNLAIFLGEDNSYSSSKSWDDTYTNYESLINAIHSNPSMKMHIEFGTLKTYFQRLRETESKLSKTSESGAFPILSGDFFPYSDWEDAYWTGYFTTRPWLKKFSRQLQSLLRSADIFSVIVFNHCKVSGECGNTDSIFNTIHAKLRTARRELGMFQHHDGITGTSLSFVVSDYETRLTSGFQSADEALKLSLLTLQTKGIVKNTGNSLVSDVKKTIRSGNTQNKFSLHDGKLQLLITNPLERKRAEVVNIRLSVKNVVIKAMDNPNKPLQYQVTMPAGTNEPMVYSISFVVPMHPLSMQTILIEESSDKTLATEVKETRPSSSDKEIVIENNNMKVYFDAQTGMITSISDKFGKRTKLRGEFMKYTSKSSGAYLFGPEGHATPLEKLTSPDIVVTRGSLYSSVRVNYRTGVSQLYHLYNTTGAQGQVIHVQNEVNLAMMPELRNVEIIWRLKSDIDNGNLFFTDQNGYQYLGRKTYPDRLIESNFYPVTSLAFIEDNAKRISVHVSQPHGVASLDSGWLEFMLDRVMMNDDKRGLGTGVMDKVLTVSDFVIQLEYKTQPGNYKEQRYNYPSLQSMVSNELLQNPLNIFGSDATHARSSKGLSTFNPETVIPCDISIVGLRNLVTNALEYNGTSIVLHRKPFSCEFSQSSNEICSLDWNQLTLYKLPLSFSNKKRVLETSLSHLHFKSETREDDNLSPNVNELRSFIINY